MQTDIPGGYDEFLRRYWSEHEDLPKHERLRQAITNSIVDGYWSPGARLPTESEWAQQTPCSLGTVQRALRSLVDDGLILRRRGSGTTVAGMEHQVAEPWHFLFRAPGAGPDDLLPVFTRVIDRRVGRETGPWSKPLEQDGRSVVRIDRIVTIDTALEVYAVFRAIAKRFPELVETPVSDLDGANLHEVMADHHHMPVYRIQQKLRMEAPPDWVTSKCAWPDDAMASIVNVVAYSVDGRSMYFQDFYIPPSPYELDLGTRIKDSSLKFTQ
ncbi:MAG: GntR family transcriptional regulator [Rhodospirillales bacterium]